MVPEGWRRADLSEVARIVLGQSPPSAEVTEDEEGFPFLQGNAEFGERHPKATSWAISPPRTAPPGSILISVRAPVGDVNRADLEYGIGRGLAAVAARNSAAMQDYLFWILANAQPYFDSRKQGSTFDAINKKDLHELPTLLPPLPEQRKIAAILSSVDDAIAATRKAVEQTQRVKQGLLQTLMTRGIGHTRFKKTEMGEIPETWGIVRLGDLVRDGGGLFVDGDWIESKDQDPAGHVRLIQLADIGEGHFLNRSNRWLTTVKAADLGCTYLSTGDLLIARMPDPIGRTCTFPAMDHPAVTAVDVVICRPGPRVDRNWLRLMLNTDGMSERIFQFATGTTRKRISRKNLSRMVIAVPPLTEQSEIAQAILPLDEQVQLSRKSISQMQRLKRGLMQDLLTGRVRVQPD